MILIERAKLRAEMTREDGMNLEARRDAVEKDALRQEGARDGLKLAAKRIAELMALVDQEFKESGTISGKKIEELNGEPLLTMSAVKLWIQRALGCVDNLATTAEVAMISMNGQVKGLNDAIGHMKKAYDTEIRKLKEIEQGLANGKFVLEEGGELTRTTPIDREHPRMVGEHPGPTLKMQRQAAEAESKADKGNGAKKASRRKKAKAEAPDAENT